MRIRSFVAWVSRAPENATDASREVTEAGWHAWSAGALRVRFAARPGKISTWSENEPLVLGDDSECRAFGTATPIAGGLPIHVEGAARQVVAWTSIVGLPPLFIYQGPQAIALASDIALLREAAGVSLSLDARAVSELGWFGHPIERRTLFRDVVMAPTGSQVTLGADGTLAVSEAWSFQPHSPLSWPDFVEAQTAAFNAAVSDTDVTNSFLSLTAGLDTRTVFSALAAQHRLIPGVTLTGLPSSLDARIARRLCAQYGAKHQAIVIDDTFTKSLPDLVERANYLSGGLSSLGQAPEVFLYRQLEHPYHARVSGNLGNQVGRGGTEGVSLRGADVRILGAALRDTVALDAHWLLGHLDQSPLAALRFIIENEIAISSVGNYTVGSHFAVQQSPYASRALIDVLARRPRSGAAPSGSRLRMRLRDLRHRFVGEPERTSFQRALVRRLDGAAARIPINWGWRPDGGLSPAGLAIGMATMAGMVARARGLDDGLFGSMVRRSGVPALHDFRESRRWLRDDLSVYVRDLLSGRGLRDAGWFDGGRLDVVLEEHFSGRQDHFETVTFALDLALARRLTT